jgi:hypothetical protein
MVLLPLRHCAPALEDQVLKLSPAGVKLVARSRFRGGCLASIVLVSQAALEVLSATVRLTPRSVCYLSAFLKSALQ